MNIFHYLTQCSPPKNFVFQTAVPRNTKGFASMHSTLLIMGYRSDIKTTYHSVPRFLIEIHILVKEVQLKSIKGKIHFSLGIIHRNERFLSEIYNWGKFTSFFPIRSHSEYLAQFLNVIILVCFNKKNPHRHHFFEPCIET